MQVCVQPQTQVFVLYNEIIKAVNYKAYFKKKAYF
jgi:hypothetical protein